VYIRTGSIVLMITATVLVVALVLMAMITTTMATIPSVRGGKNESLHQFRILVKTLVKLRPV
jgi:hypothetical protein